MTEYDCAYCPLGGVGEPVMLDGHPAHPDCEDACTGMTTAQLAEVREAVTAGLAEYVSRCPACGDPIDYCQGHGEIGDPAGRAILDAHDEGHHNGCHPDGCDTARAENDWKTWRNAWIPGGE